MPFLSTFVVVVCMMIGLGPSSAETRREAANLFPTASNVDSQQHAILAGGGRFLQDASFSPTPNLMTPRCRDRTTHVDLATKTIAVEATCSSSESLPTSLGARCAVLRI